MHFRKMLETYGLDPEVFDVIDRIKPAPSFQKESGKVCVFIPVFVSRNKLDSMQRLAAA